MQPPSRSCVACLHSMKGLEGSFSTGCFLRPSCSAFGCRFTRSLTEPSPYSYDGNASKFESHEALSRGVQQQSPGLRLLKSRFFAYTPGPFIQLPDHRAFAVPEHSLRALGLRVRAQDSFGASRKGSHIGPDPWADRTSRSNLAFLQSTPKEYDSAEWGSACWILPGGAGDCAAETKRGEQHVLMPQPWQLQCYNGYGGWPGKRPRRPAWSSRKA